MAAPAVYGSAEAKTMEMRINLTEREHELLKAVLEAAAEMAEVSGGDEYEAKGLSSPDFAREISALRAKLGA